MFYEELITSYTKYFENDFSVSSDSRFENYFADKIKSRLSKNQQNSHQILFLIKKRNVGFSCNLLMLSSTKIKADFL